MCCRSYHCHKQGCCHSETCWGSYNKASADVPTTKRAAGAAIAMAAAVVIAKKNYHGHIQCCYYLAHVQPLSECWGVDQVTRKSEAMELRIVVEILSLCQWHGSCRPGLDQDQYLLGFQCWRARRVHVRESWTARSGQRLCCRNWGGGRWLQNERIWWKVWCGTDPTGRRCWWWWWDYRLTARSKTKSRHLMVSSQSELKSGLGSRHWH